MRSLASYAASLFLAAFLFGAPGRAQAQAQASSEAFASSAAYVSPGTGTDDSSPVADPHTAKPGEMLVLTGKITNPAGVLPGAVVILTGTRQMAVTNADGEFSFTVPANAGPLPARVTYAGYADEPMTLNADTDESTVSLTNARVVVVARRQQLGRYLKTARKQVRRELRRVRG